MPGCKSGYRSQPKDPSVSFHRFPREPDQLARWLVAIPRQGGSWRPGPEASVCSLHFLPEDVEKERTDRHRWRNRSKGERRRAGLKPHAVPTVFPAALRTPARKAVPATLADCESGAEVDEIRCFEQLEANVEDVALPAGVEVLSRRDSVLFVSFLERQGLPLEVRFYLKVEADLQFQMAVHSAIVPNKRAPAGRGDKIRSFSGISNILTFLEGLADGQVQKDLMIVKWG